MQHPSRPGLHFAWFGLALTLAACSSGSGNSGGTCQTDDDCGGSRRCVEGRCVFGDPGDADAVSDTTLDAFDLVPRPPDVLDTSGSGDQPAPLDCTGDDCGSGTPTCPAGTYFDGEECVESPCPAGWAGACLVASPPVVSFPTSAVGIEHRLPLTLINCGTVDVSISAIEFTDGTTEFRIEIPGGGPQPGAPLIIPAGTRRMVDVVFAPTEPSPLDPDRVPVPEFATFRLHSNACTPELLVRTTGVASNCPVAVIACLEGEDAVPQTVLHLVGDRSFGQAGRESVVGWRWSVQQPDGSQSVFLPSDAVANPTFEANIAGTYVFHLTVWDDAGVPSCNVADYQVVVIPNEAIHIELTWQTPGDADETDSGRYMGSDLDLHFLHPLAPSDPDTADVDGDGAPDPYFDTFYDCFWFNIEPDWAIMGTDAPDNPSLDRDDRDGAGPENVNLGVPEEGLTYRVAVHYWDDNDFGPARATVRVYILSRLAFEVQNVMLRPRDLWCVAFIDWPSGRVRACQDPRITEPTLWITHDYENPDFLAPGS